ncbi:MAG: hypothetical protein LKE33_07940 [Acidaminococcus sp.]|nr:hypothetical protein [Acidaminococcus sp.]MCI2100639.1 hypothetical protein [Acidaminococcus sp.]MCI2117021.1 hypothetical protein [Acidaminococcus sp.]
MVPSSFTTRSGVERRSACGGGIASFMLLKSKTLVVVLFVQDKIASAILFPVADGGVRTTECEKEAVKQRAIVISQPL